MFKVIDGGNKNKIVDAKAGETILITLITGKIEKVIISDINKIGVEGFDVNLKSQPLTFYPFNNILKIVKYNNLEGG
jgi:hypothetical protein